MAKSKLDWYAPLAQLVSKGLQTEKATDLAGLHVARTKHQGQFFTPNAIVKAMWKISGLADNQRDSKYYTTSIYDSSFGSGRMFQFASPKAHTLYGIEPDVQLAQDVIAVIKDSGFRCELVIGGMQEIHATGHADVGLLNPPFSIQFDSPALQHFPTNSFGKYGSGSSAVSHRYAIHAALDCCRTLVAVLPRPFINEILESKELQAERLVAVLHLPKDAFKSEGANVDTSIAVWGPHPGWREQAGPVQISTLSNLDLAPQILTIIDRPDYHSNIVKFQNALGHHGARAVTLPVTHDKRVRIGHNGRRVNLKFGCAITQARVLNYVYDDHVRPSTSKDQRTPDGVSYSGEGKLDLECHLAQVNPMVSFQEFVNSIASLGFEPIVDPGIMPYLRKKARLYDILSTPYKHWVHLHDSGMDMWLVNQRHKHDRESNKPLKAVVTKAAEFRGTYNHRIRDNLKVEPGDELELTYDGNTKNKHSNPQGKHRWRTYVQQCSHYLEEEFMAGHLQFPTFKPKANDWTLIHKGLKHSHTAEFNRLASIGRQMGLDKWCTWEYQFDDLVEVCMKKGNTIVGWDMGLGKARLSLAIVILGGGHHNLINVEAHLVKEMVTEIKTLNIPESQWQVVTEPEHVRNLKQINICTYSRMKSRIAPEVAEGEIQYRNSAGELCKRRHVFEGKTFASQMRRRIHTHIADEGHLLRNPDTDQSQAVWQISAKRRYAMSGTPVANYPRDVLPIIQWVTGDGTAIQPFGKYYPYMEKHNVKTLSQSRRGTDKFREMFVVLEWVTNEFADDLRTGAKREIPKINDVHAFRSMMAPVLKRRIMEEPEVAKYVKVPKPVYVTTQVPWDQEHLLYYYKTAQEFVNWYKNLHDRERKGIGLIAILAKMQAVYTAANNPQDGVGLQRPYPRPTSKQRYAMERIRTMVKEGHKVIFLCNSPNIVEYMSRHLEEIPHIKFHGKITINQRIKALDDNFRYGNYQLALVTKGTFQTGYNVHQADRVIASDRSWTPQIENQAIARVLRPQQKRQVVVEFLHLPGSIDDYQGQMVAAKSESMKAGLDFGNEDPERDFLHIETILGRFADDFEKRFGLKLQEAIK